MQPYTKLSTTAWRFLMGGVRVSQSSTRTEVQWATRWSWQARFTYRLSPYRGGTLQYRWTEGRVGPRTRLGAFVKRKINLSRNPKSCRPVHSSTLRWVMSAQNNPKSCRPVHSSTLRWVIPAQNNPKSCRPVHSSTLRWVISAQNNPKSCRPVHSSTLRWVIPAENNSKSPRSVHSSTPVFPKLCSTEHRCYARCEQMIHEEINKTKYIDFSLNFNLAYLVVL
jgi:hypothetical protein